MLNTAKNIFKKVMDRYFAQYYRKVPEQKFFEEMYSWLSNVEKTLLINGYDQKFMDSETTRQIIKKLADDELELYISAILPENISPTYLEELTPNKVELIKVPKEMKKGYMIFDDWGIYFWDEEKPTPYKKEKNKEVILREAYTDWYFIWVFTIYHNNLRNLCMKKNA